MKSIGIQTLFKKWNYFADFPCLHYKNNFYSMLIFLSGSKDSGGQCCTLGSKWDLVISIAPHTSVQVNKGEIFMIYDKFEVHIWGDYGHLEA